MTYKICAVLLLLIAVAMIPVAYANHPLTHGYDDHGCFEFYFNATNTYTTNCWWSYSPNEREQEIIQAEKEAVVDAPEIVDEAIITEPKPTRLDTTDPKQMMEFYVDKLEAKAEQTELSVADKELLKMLESVQEICYFGIEEGKPIQKFAMFVIPTYEPDVETELSNKWLLNQLFKKQQECSGWDIYKEKWLGQQYLDIETIDINKMEEIKKKLLERYPHDFTDPVTQRDLDDENMRSLRTICASNLWGNDFKKDTGCLYEGELNGGTIEFSTAGQKIMDKWQVYQETGQLDKPKPKAVDAPLERDSIARQYLEALGYTPDEVDAAIAALEKEK